MASNQESQPLKNKTSVVLRVSIHCEGCKRKVTKLLQSLPGVDAIEIERLQQRVVVTGDVKPETLITKLVKSGKNAELWPQMVQESVVSGKEMKSSPIKTEADPSKVTTTAVPSVGDTAGKGGEKVDEGEKVQEDVKVEEKKPETGPIGNTTASPTTVVEKKEQQNEDKNNVGGGEGGGGGDGEGKKNKKKKKPQTNKSGSMGETSSIGPPQQIGSNQNVPRHQHPLPCHNYTSTPEYTMSYNTAHPPVNTYTTSYYAPSPPPQSYAYSHFGSEMHPPPNVPQPMHSNAYGYEMAPPPSVPSYYESYRLSSSVDSFEMFSDENPNGCLVM